MLSAPLPWVTLFGATGRPGFARSLADIIHSAERLGSVRPRRADASRLSARNLRDSRVRAQPLSDQLSLIADLLERDRSAN